MLWNVSQVLYFCFADFIFTSCEDFAFPFEKYKHLIPDITLLHQKLSLVERLELQSLCHLWEQGFLVVFEKRHSKLQMGHKVFNFIVCPLLRLFARDFREINYPLLLQSLRMFEELQKFSIRVGHIVRKSHRLSLFICLMQTLKTWIVRQRLIVFLFNLFLDLRLVQLVAYTLR